MPVKIYDMPVSDVSAAEIERWRAIPVAIAADLGTGVGQIDPAIRTLHPIAEKRQLFGRALTVQCEPPDFGAVLHALDLARPGDVLVIAASGHLQHAMAGEIAGRQLCRMGGMGLVCDGAVRDVAALVSLPGLAVFARGTSPRGPTSADSGAVNATVTVGGCSVAPGDLIMGDDDGLIVVSPATIRDRMPEAMRKIARETEIEASLSSGRTVLQTLDLSPTNHAR